MSDLRRFCDPSHPRYCVCESCVRAVGLEVMDDNYNMLMAGEEPWMTIAEQVKKDRIFRAVSDWIHASDPK